MVRRSGLERLAVEIQPAVSAGFVQRRQRVAAERRTLVNPADPGCSQTHSARAVVRVCKWQVSKESNPGRRGWSPDGHHDL